MNIRKKMVLYFSSTTILVTALTALLIYSLFSGYRRNEFQQRLKDKVVFSLKFLDRVQQTTHSLLKHLDRLTINDIYEEKMYLFDEQKKLIFASLDDTKIKSAPQLLQKLNPGNRWIETREGDFDVIATAVNIDGKEFYGIYKAYDTYGYQQMRYLKYILLGAFGFITLVTLLISYYLSGQISSPINRMTQEIESLDLNKGPAAITVPPTQDEIHYLARKFNELMRRLELSFSFQKHAIHHVSHELKTPIAVLVSNFEKMEGEQDLEKLHRLITIQKEGTLSLSDTINALLEIAKVEAGNAPEKMPVRIDELLFDIIEKLQPLAPDFTFRVNFSGAIEQESSLVTPANPRLMTMAFTNLLLNCIRYASTSEALITIHAENGHLSVTLQNTGNIIRPEERKFLFHYYFRGENSRKHRGFGLGLVMVQKILALHQGTISYHAPDSQTNVFTVTMKPETTRS